MERINYDNVNDIECIKKFEIQQKDFEGLFLETMNNGINDPRLAIALNLSEITKFKAIFSSSDLPLLSAYRKELNKKMFKTSLDSMYDSLSKTLLKEVEDLLISAHQTPINIPPIVALVLDKASNPKEIPQVTLEYRKEFKSLRVGIREYENTIQNNKISLKKRLKAKRELESISKELTNAYSPIDVTDIAEWSDLAIILDMDALEEGKIIKTIFGKHLKKAKQMFLKRKAGHLFTIRNKFLSLEEYSSLLKKVFNIEMTNDFKDDLSNILFYEKNFYKNMSINGLKILGIQEEENHL